MDRREELRFTQEYSRALPQWRAVVLALGERAFPRLILHALQRLVQVDHLSLFVFDHELIPHLVGAASRESVQIAVAVGRLYEKASFYRYDPNTDHIRHDCTSQTTMVFRLRASDICNATYRDQIYTRHRLIERVSLIDHIATRWMAFNVYRNRSSGYFTDSQVATLRELSGVLTGLAGKHVALVDSIPVTPRTRLSSTFLETLLTSLNERLTLRERQVCARALIGMTVRGIALDLQVKDATVATLRQRAYAKCNISSLNELFALCLGQLARAGSAERMC